MKPRTLPVNPFTPRTVNTPRLSSHSPHRPALILLIILSQLISSSLGDFTSFGKELKKLSDTDYKVSFAKDLIRKQHGAVHFDPNIGNYTHIIFNGNDIYVTASGRYIFQLDLKELKVISHHEMKTKEMSKLLCKQESKNTCEIWEDIKYLGITPDRPHVYYCYAFNRIYLGQLASENHGRSGCAILNPFMIEENPIMHWQVGLIASADTMHRSIVLSASDGFIYIGSFHSESLKITRTKFIDQNGRNDMSTTLVTPSNMMYINEPAEFIYSFEANDAVYFLLVEKSIESYVLCNRQKKTATRIMRVCKNDPGGLSEMNAEQNFATTAKADLDCSTDGYHSYLFRYSEIQAAHWDSKNKLLYVTFSSNSNGPHGSALCVYSLSSIEKSFSGPYRRPVQHRQTTFPKSQMNQVPNMCSDLNKTKLSTEQIKTIQIKGMSFLYRVQPISPISNKPSIRSSGEIWHQIAVHEVRVKTRSKLFKTITIIVTASNKRVIRFAKYSANKICEIEEIRLTNSDETSDEYIKVMKLQKQEKSELPHIYLGTSKQLMRLPLAQCFKYATREQCLKSRDPMCGWNSLILKCVSLTEDNFIELEQDISQNLCPEVELTTTTELKSKSEMWSKWTGCSMVSKPTENQYITDCLCRYCLKEGFCSGKHQEITNCSMNGGWTLWSDWSQCSEPCGDSGIQTRQRSCDSPRPLFRGNPCLGKTKEKRLCQPTPAPCSAGAWSSWGKWSACSSKCGSGYSTRIRQCLDRNECKGNSQEIRDCFKQCNTRKLSDWTEWLSIGDSTSDTQRRYRFVCAINSSIISGIHSPQILTEEKDCSSSNQCQINLQTLPRDGRWSSWSSWSQCSESCGSNGVERRFRNCLSNDDSRKLSCDGDSEEVKNCETLPECPSLYLKSQSCWSEWSSCSTTCGEGMKERHLLCSETTRCRPNSFERLSCQEKPCSKLESEKRWKSWASWSECNENDHRFRTRECKPDSLCIGASVEYKSCLTVDLLTTAGNVQFSILHLVYMGLGGTLLGAIVAAIVGSIIWKRKVNKERSLWERSKLNSSPYSSENSSRKLSHKKARETLGHDDISSRGFSNYSGFRPLLRSFSTTDSGINFNNCSQQSRDIHHLNNLSSEHFQLDKVPPTKYSIDGLDESCSVFSDSTNNAQSSVFSNSQNKSRCDDWQRNLHNLAHDYNIGRETELTSMPSIHLPQYNPIRDLSPQRTRQTYFPDPMGPADTIDRHEMEDGEAPYVPSRLEGSMSVKSFLPRPRKDRVPPPAYL